MDDRGQEVLNYERELQNMRVNNAMLQEFSDNLKAQLRESEENLQKSRHEYFEMLQNRETVKSELEQVSDEAANLKNHKLELVQLLEKKNDEISRLKETINTIESFKTNSGDALNSSFGDLKLKEIQLNFEVNRLNNERTLYSNQIKQLTEDVELKSTELINLRKESTLEKHQATRKIEHQSTEIHNLHLEVHRLKGLMKSLEDTNADVSKKYLELQVQCTKLESAYTKENEAQKDVIDLLVKQNEEMEDDLSAKVKDNNELRGILQKGYEAHEALEIEFKTMKESYMNDIKELESDRANLKEELEESKAQVSQFNKRCIEKEFEKHFPLAIEANRQLNMVSLSELYNEHIQTKQEKEILAETNAKLSEEIRILEDKLNEDKPIMYKNIQNYKQMANSYVNLESELMTLLADKQKYIAEKDEDTRQINLLSRQIKRFEHENSELSHQIQHLLKSVHESEGYAMQDSSIGMSIIDQLSIPNNMITFRNIQELQERNRQLLELLNKCHEELGDNPSSTPDGERDNLANLRNELDEYKHQVKQLTTELSQKNELLDQSGASKQPRVSSSDDIFDLNPKQMAVEIKELKGKVEKYQDKIEDCRQQRLADIRILENAKNNLITENVNIKADVLKLKSELDAKAHYIESADSMLDKYQKENTDLRERNIRLNSDVAKFEKDIIYLKSEIAALKESVKQSEKTALLAQSERDIYKNNELSLIRENAAVKDDLENHKKLVYSLRTIQENFNKVENESVHSLQLQIDNLQKNNNYYREKLDKQEEKLRNSVSDFCARFDNLQVLLDKEKNNSIELQRKYFDLQVQHQKEIEKVAAAAASEAAAAGNSSVISSDQKRQLVNLQDEVKVLKGKLANSEATCENMKSMNQSLEANLNKLMHNNEGIKHDFESELQSKLSMIKMLNGQLETTRQEYELIVNQKNATIEQAKATADENAQQIEELKKMLVIQQETSSKALENEQNLADDLTYQRAIAAKAMEDYEAEVALHAGDSTTIFELKMQVESAQKSLFEKDAEIAELKDQTSLNANLWESQRKSLFEEGDALKVRCSSLENTNETLLSQIDLLNNQVIALQNNSDIFALDEANQQENANQLLGVVKFLREEKAQLQSKLSKLNDEHVCLQVEVQNYMKEIVNLKNALEIEKQSTSRMSNMNEFNDLLSKAELVPILTENNSHMRIEINHLEARCSELMEKIARFEMNEKAVSELSNKAEVEAVEQQYLRQEAEQWKIKANSLSQQLKNFDSDSIKRLLAEKTNVSKQNQALQIDRNKLKQELDNATNKIKQEVEEKAKLIVERNKLQDTTVQLRALARKFKNEISRIKTGGQAMDTSDISDRDIAGDQMAGTSQDNQKQIEDLLLKLQKKEEDNQKHISDIAKISQENELLRRTANEKDEKARKIAEKAKQRICEAQSDKMSLVKEKETLSREIDALKAKILELQTIDEQQSQHLNLLKSQYNSKISQQDKDLQEANKQIESLTLQLQQPATTSCNPVAVAPAIAIPIPASTTATTSSALSGAPAARLSVLPQQPAAVAPSIAAVKATPTASIKPLTVAASRSPVASRSINSGYRPVTMVQPTASAEENLNTQQQPTSMGSAVPQATVQPTQPDPVPSSVSSTLTTAIEVSEASTSEVLSLFAPSTSAMSVTSAEDKKRSFDSSDEPSSSNSKKLKIASFTTEQSDSQNEENSHDVELEQSSQPNIGGYEAEVVNLDDDDEPRVEENESNSADEEIGQHDEEMIEDDEDNSADEVEELEEDESNEHDEDNFERAHDERSFHELNSDEDEEEDEEERDVGEDEFDDEDEDHYEEEEDDDDDLEVIDESEEEGDSSDIEVIAIDDSDEEEADNNSNPAASARNQVSSSHATTRNATDTDQANQSQASNELTTTTNEGGDASSGQNRPNIFAGNFQFGNTFPQSSQGESNNSQSIAPDSETDSNKQAVTSQTSAIIEASAPESSQGNVSEIASSSTAPASSNQTARRPVTWPQNADDSQGNPQQGQPMSNRRQLYVRGQRVPARRGNQRGMPRGGTCNRGNRF